MDTTKKTTTKKFFSSFPSTSSIISAYATVSTTITLLKPVYYQLVPAPVHHRLTTFLYDLFHAPSTIVFTLLVEEYDGVKRNPLFEAFEAYLCDKATTDSISAGSGESVPLTLNLARNEEFTEMFDEAEIGWVFSCSDPPDVRPETSYSYNRDEHEIQTSVHEPRVRRFTLYFLKEHKDLVVNSYIPRVLEAADKIMNKERILKLWTLKMSGYSFEKKGKWESVKLNHPSTFDSLALDPNLKKFIIDDLNLFLERKEFYRKVGRSWKRGYLLYGPPGTDKSSLIAAIANYLKFDVYDLQLMHIEGDDMLRKLLLSTTNRSILVIEDIDCSMGLPEKRTYAEDESESDDDDDKKKQQATNAGTPIKISLSGLLNFIDGLWSSCGDERIIIFTTNHKDRLDPALLRPGRMDMHVYMLYLAMPAFKILASNYLDIPFDSSPHPRYEEIQEMIKTINVTPAEVAEELMKNKDVDVALDGVVELLKRKRAEIESERIEKERVNNIRKNKKEAKARKKELL